MLEKTAEQQPAHFLHRMLEGEDDGCDEVVLFATALNLTEKILQNKKRCYFIYHGRTASSKQCQILIVLA